MSRPDLNQQWLSRLQAVECRDSTYPGVDPALVFERARGSYIYDVAGNEYIDLCAGFGVMALGHNDPLVMRELHAYLADAEKPKIVHGMGDVYPSRPKIELLETLKQFLPPALTRGALALGGGQAVEIAVKTALLATGRKGFITFDQSYHGLDLGILPLTYRRDFKEPFTPWLADSLVSSLPFGADTATLQQAMDAQQAAGFGTAAIMVEPIQGRAGVCLPPAGWLQSLRDVCDRRGVLLIYDEIFVGLGRTGVWTHAEQVPCDLVAFGKSMGGGMPLSACFGTEQVMQAWPQNTGEALHTGTFFGHPLSCFAGLVMLRELKRRDLAKQSAILGKWWLEHLQNLLGDFSSVKDIRGQGLMIAIEFAKPGQGARVSDILRKKHVIALPSGPRGESLSLTPALTISRELIAEASARITTAIADSVAEF